MEPDLYKNDTISAFGEEQSGGSLNFNSNYSGNALGLNNSPHICM